MAKLERCPICQLEKVKNTILLGAGDICCECGDCGTYIMPRHVFSILQREDVIQDKHVVRQQAAVMLERNLKGLNNGVRVDFANLDFCFTDTKEEIVARFPSTFQGRLERGFLNVVRALPNSPLKSFAQSDIKHDLRNILFIDEECIEASVVLQYMCDEGWLKSVSESGIRRYMATTKGMAVYDLAKAAGSSRNAFLAMWFGIKEFDLYHASIQQAVEKAGYHLQLVNKEEYNGFIMDKVINLINDSAFVIADISAMPERKEGSQIVDGVRGGVYWEAGYASGQKKQVILTCRDDDDSTKRIHFDLEQYNQIRWKQKGDKIVTVDGRDFVDAIEQRILVTVGRGKTAL